MTRARLFDIAVLVLTAGTCAGLTGEDARRLDTDRRRSIVGEERNPVTKQFKIPASQIRSVAPGLGSAFASDMITVDGKRVGYMYREEPDGDTDSGWRFLSGDESQAYLDDAAHLEIYDVNTIASYDPDIVPHLSAPVGWAFEREDGGPLVEIAAEN